MISIPLQNNTCTSCSACISICPKDHLHLSPDSCGFLYPSITENTACTECNLCVAVCPITNDFQENKSVDRAFAASLLDTEELRKSASGGIATALSHQIIKEHGCVYGVAYTPSFASAEFQKATSVLELERFRGSKYIQADKGTAYIDIRNELKRNSEYLVLFIGLPCETAGLKSFLGKEYKNLITVDLICYGATSPSVANEYTDYLKKKFHSNICDFTVRFKKDGCWTPPYLRAEFENERVFLKPFYATEYGKAFNMLPRSSCFSCKFKGKNHVSDLTIGDFWGCMESDSFWNPSGVSVVIAHSEKGLSLLSSLTSVSLTEVGYERAIEKNPMYSHPRVQNAIYDKFHSDFVLGGLFSAVRKSVPRWKRCLGSVINRLPGPIKACLKSLYSRCR